MVYIYLTVIYTFNKNQVRRCQVLKVAILLKVVINIADSIFLTINKRMVQEEKQNVMDSNKKSVSNDTNHFTTVPPTKNSEREEYMRSLQQWIYEARIWQSAALHFPYYMIGYQSSEPTSSAPTTTNESQPAPNQNNRGNFRQLFQPADVRRGPPISK